MQKNSDNFSMQDAIRLAQSDAGRRLLAVLQAQNGDAVRKATDQAAAGDYEQMKETISSLLASPEAQALLEQLRRQGNG